MNCPITTVSSQRRFMWLERSKFLSVWLGITRGWDLRTGGSNCLLGSQQWIFWWNFASIRLKCFTLISPTIPLSQCIFERISQSVSIFCWLLPGGVTLVGHNCLDIVFYYYDRKLLRVGRIFTVIRFLLLIFSQGLQWQCKENDFVWLILNSTSINIKQKSASINKCSWLRAQMKVFRLRFYWASPVKTKIKNEQLYNNACLSQINDKKNI